MKKGLQLLMILALFLGLASCGDLTDGNESCNHIISDWIIDTEATCKVEGAKHKECTICHTELETSKIDKLTTHISAEAVRENEVSAKCNVAGSYDEVVRCADCNEIISTIAKTIPETNYHTWKNGACTVCSGSIFDGAYEEMTTDEVVGFSNNLTPYSMDFEWGRGVSVFFSNISNGVSVDHSGVSSTQKNQIYWKMLTSSENSQVIAYYTFSHTALLDGYLDKVQTRTAYYDQPYSYIEFVEHLSNVTRTKKEETFSDFLQSVGITNNYFNYTTFSQLMLAGYYENVYFGKCNDEEFIKIKMQVPEQEHDGFRNSVRVVFVYDKDYNLISFDYELNMYEVSTEDYSESKVTVILSDEKVPSAPNPDDYS